MQTNDTRLRSLEFDFPLPRERVAQRPKPHAEQKLLVYRRGNKHIEHRMFSELATILRAGDLLVVNDSKVVPVLLRRADGVNILFLEPLHRGWTDLRVLCPSKPKAGDKFDFPQASAQFVFKAREPGGVYVGDLVTDRPYESLRGFLETLGNMPLPPYIKREPDDRDQTDYQTDFARVPGSIACPTAALHFDQDLVARLKSNGVEFSAITLHIGRGTFRPFMTKFVDEHIAETEKFSVTRQSLEQVGRAKREGRRIIAIGTTVTRTLESMPGEIERFEEIQSDVERETSLFIFPPFEFQIISALLTNLAAPKNPVMSMAAAFVGLDELKRLYQSALDNGYMFYSYGDAMLLL